jgi:hypothetical protein
MGEYKDGKPNGHGTYTWHTGSQYEGEFLDGLKHGKGAWKKSKDELNCNRYQGFY